MSSTKLNPTRALTIVPSDYCNVPSPNLLLAGIGSGVGSSDVLVDLTAKFFITNSSGNREYVVNTGDVVYGYDTIGNLWYGYTVIEVIDQNTLKLNATINWVNYNYYIYQEGPQTGLGNEGCLLYIGGSLLTPYSLAVTTIGGDYMVIDRVPVGLLPIQIKKVWATNTNIEQQQIFGLW